MKVARALEHPVNSVGCIDNPNKSEQKMKEIPLPNSSINNKEINR